VGEVGAWDVEGAFVEICSWEGNGGSGVMDSLAL
jgi:hypothetical protein